MSLQSDKNGGDESFPLDSYSILAIDLGTTTGLAYYNSSGFLHCYSTDTPHILEFVLTFLNAETVILERFPEQRTMQSYQVEKAYGQIAERARMISPGEWKPFMKAQEKIKTQAKNRHEKDAVNILRYYMITELGEDIE